MTILVPSILSWNQVSSKLHFIHVYGINIITGAIYSFILMMELLLYAIGQNFVFVLYTSMAQITVRVPNTPYQTNADLLTRELPQLVSSYWFFLEGPCVKRRDLRQPHYLPSERPTRPTHVWVFLLAGITFHPLRSTFGQVANNRYGSTSNEILKSPTTLS